MCRTAAPRGLPFPAILMVASFLAPARGEDAPAIGETIIIPASDRAILGVAFARDGKSVWAASEDGTTRQWNFAKKQVIGQLGEPAQRVNAVAISQDGKTIATGGRGALGLWNADTRQAKVSLAPEQSVVMVDLSPDGRYLAVAYFRTDQSAVIDSTTGKTVATLTAPTYPGNTPERSDGLPIGAVAWSPDGKYLAACNAPPFFATVASLYDAKTFALRARFFAHPANRSYCLAFSPDGKLLACGTQDAHVKVFDVAAVVVAWEARIKPPPGGDDRVAAKVAHLGAELGSDDFGRRESASRELARQGPPALAPLKKLVAESSDEEVRSRAKAIVDMLTEEIEGPLKGLHPVHILNVPRIGNVRSLAFSPDGALLAVGCMKLGTPEGQLEIWQLDKPTRPRSVLPDRPVNWLAFSPDGNWVASGLTGGNLLLTKTR